eukprot:RCo037450
MFPVDTVKTRLQASRKELGLLKCLRVTFRDGGLRAFYRGVGPGICGAFPSHAAYFTVYEKVKQMLHLDERLRATVASLPFLAGLAGACATVGHDLFHTPFDVLKQRLQISGGTVGVVAMIKKVLMTEGVRAFYVSMPTTILMNVPFSSAHFATYETVKTLLGASDTDMEHSFWKYAVAGGLGGACGGIVSNPLDVIKTRQQVGALQAVGVFEAFRTSLQADGARVLTRGLGARVLYFAPSAAISMTSYEVVKWGLRQTSLARWCQLPDGHGHHEHGR